MNILIVEDDPMVGRINRQFAEKTGLAQRIESAEAVDEAKTLLEKADFDLVLLDVYLPGEKGTSLLRWIRKKELPASVILITADRNPQTIELALNLGAADYLVKPFTYERFNEALLRVDKRIVRLQSSGSFEQEAIDSIFGEPVLPQAEQLEKGLNRHTYDKILEAAGRRSGSFTAEELSSWIGISRVTVRRYLEHMEGSGILSKKMEYGKPGRPLNYYRLSRRTHH
ncbi:MAG: response regulator [Spirochaetales bacterium]|nr:response regulator [Spirochaetales bacterium]